MLINLCRDRWRQTTNRERLGRAAPRDIESDPESALVAKSVVWAALATLDPRRRAVLVMHELEGAMAAGETVVVGTSRCAAATRR